MGVLELNGTSARVRFGSLSTALKNVGLGAWTLAALTKRKSLGSWSGLIEVRYESWGFGANLELNPSDQVRADNGSNSTGTGLLLNSTAKTYLVVVSKAAGVVAPRGMVRNITDGTTARENLTNALSTGSSVHDPAWVNFGVWSDTSDWFNGYLGLGAVWDIALTDAQMDELWAHKKTSDFWNNSAGRPLFLSELKSTTPTDLAAGAMFDSTTATLNSSETLEAWNFDGKGVVAPVGYSTVDAVNVASKRASVLGAKTGSQFVGSASAFMGSMWPLPSMGGSGRWPAGLLPPAVPGATVDINTTGAFPLPPAVAGKTRYLLRARSRTPSNSGTPGKTLLYDRLVHAGQISWTPTTQQPVNTVALPRFTSGDGVILILENQNSNLANPGMTVQIGYTNEQGVGGRSTGFQSWSQASGWSVLIMPLDAGDYGVQSVQDITFTAASSGASAVTVILAKPICWLQMGSESSASRSGDSTKDWKFLGMPQVAPDACLAMVTDQFQGVGAEAGPFIDLLFGDA